LPEVNLQFLHEIETFPSFFIFIMGLYQVDVLQLQMVIAGYFTQLWACHYTTVISAIESSNDVACF
jgi:hypothetical protein